MNDRKTQAVILLISLMVICYGFYKIMAGGSNDLVELHDRPNYGASAPMICVFLLAFPVAFFCARNLWRKK